jgi:hypothetical protein
MTDVALARATSVNCELALSNGTFSTANAEFVIRQDTPAFLKMSALDKVIERVNSFLGSLKRPDRPEIVVSAIEMPSASVTENRIRLGVQIGRDKGSLSLTHNPAYLRAILAHEFGHIVLAENFPLLKDLYSQIRGVESELKPQIEKYEFLSEQIEELSVRGLGIDSGLLVQTRADLEEKIEGLRPRWLELRSTLDLLEPYEEFVADVVSVLEGERPDVIHRSVHFSKLNKPRKASVNTRHFKKHMQRSTRILLSYYNYSLFMFARRDLWNSYLASPSIMRNRKEDVLKAVIAAVVSEATSVAQGVDTGAALNERLIARIHEELHRRGIEPLK